MKRTLAISLSTLALAAISANALAQAPQPSFVDYVAITAAPSSGSTARAADLSRAFPQPSFVDYVAIAPAPSGAGSTVAAVQGFPQPSFSN